MRDYTYEEHRRRKMLSQQYPFSPHEAIYFHGLDMVNNGETNERISVMDTPPIHQENRLFNDIEFQSKLKALFSHDRYRRTGRSHVLAKVLIEIALETGEHIAFVDHHDVFNISHRHKYEFMKMVREIIDEYLYYGVDIQIIDLNEKGMRLRLGNTRYTSPKSPMDIYRRMRIPDYFPDSTPKPKQKEVDLLLITCNI